MASRADVQAHQHSRKRKITSPWLPLWHCKFRQLDISLLPLSAGSGPGRSSLDTLALLDERDSLTCATGR